MDGQENLLKGNRNMVPSMEMAAIFDWDGVVIDSSQAHEQSWELLGREVRQPLPKDHFERGFGQKNQYIIPHILHWTNNLAEIERLGDRKEELYRQIVTQTGVAIIPGIENFLRRLNHDGIPCAVGSSTPRLNLETLLDRVGFRRYFQTFVSAEDVSRGKPDPEVFLTCASRLGRTPDQCAVFEDAFVGLEAARNGGMKTVALATTHPREKLEPHRPDLILDNFLGFRPEHFSTFFHPG